MEKMFKTLEEQIEILKGKEHGGRRAIEGMNDE